MELRRWIRIISKSLLHNLDMLNSSFVSVLKSPLLDIDIAFPFPCNFDFLGSSFASFVGNRKFDADADRNFPIFQFRES